MKDTFFVIWFVAAFFGVASFAFLWDAKTWGEVKFLAAVSAICWSAVFFLPI